MSRLPILTNPNDELRHIAEPVLIEEITTPEFQALIDNMIETMVKADGIGIAGPQISTKKRLFIGVLHNQPYAFINPVISGESFRKVNSEEGCLSIPGVWGMVRRHRYITVEYHDREGIAQKRKLSGLEGIVVQHETDHLDGVLFIDKVTRYTTTPQAL